MEEILRKTSDFGIRVIELSSYLESEGRSFARIGRLLECGTGIAVLMRVSAGLPQFGPENCILAYRLATEAEYLFELMVETGVLTEHQSRPILSDCRSIREEIGNLLEDGSGKSPDTKRKKEGRK